MDEWMLQNGPEAEMTGQGELNAQDGNDLMANLDAISAEPTVHETSKEEPEDDEEQETELARTAQELVDLLANNDSDKFKNSEFISLMRRVASRQLTVQGNDLVETLQPPTSTETSTASATLSTASHQPVSIAPTQI